MENKINTNKISLRIIIWMVWEKKVFQHAQVEVAVMMSNNKLVGKDSLGKHKWTPKDHTIWKIVPMEYHLWLVEEIQKDNLQQLKHLTI